jgi:hypothetical protein
VTFDVALRMMERECSVLPLVEKRMLCGMFGSKRDEATGGCRKLRNEEIRNFYSSLIIIRIMKSRRMRCAGLLACMGELRNAYKVVLGDSGGKRSLGRCRRRWEGNIKIGRMEIRLEVWI